MNMCMCMYFFNPKDYCLNTLQPFIPHTIVALLLLFEMDKSQNWPGFDWFKIIYLFIKIISFIYIVVFFSNLSQQNLKTKREVQFYFSSFISQAWMTYSCTS